MSGVRRKTAEHLSHAWAAIPHVTQFDKADMTVLEEIRPKYAAEAESQGGKLTVTAVVTKIVATALRKFPQFNVVDRHGDQDDRLQEIRAHRHRRRHRARPARAGRPQRRPEEHHRRSRPRFSSWPKRRKARKLSLDEMSGGSMSITNLGGIGGTAFTPIVNWPEVAILGHLARRRSSRCSRTARSCRGRCCRCRSATTIG